MPLEFTISVNIKASPDAIYQTWMTSKGHTLMTGGDAEINDGIGAAFEAWDGYIQGENLILEPGKRIVQGWRTVEFDENEENSQIDITLEPIEGGTKLTLHHSHLPPHGMQYKQGWIDNYFIPMKEYLES